METMLTTNEFRSGLKSYLDRVDKGEKVLIKRTKGRLYEVTLVGNGIDDKTQTEAFLKRFGGVLSEKEADEMVSYPRLKPKA